MAGIDFRIDVTVGNDQVLPPVVVDVQECCAPSKILSVHRQSRSDGSVVGVICADISVKSVRVVSEGGLETVQQAIAIIVTCGHSHPYLFAAVFVAADS